MENSVDLKYSGARRLPGIDAEEAAQILSNSRKFFLLVSREINGMDARTDVRVKSYREGSDFFDLVVHAAALASPLMGQASSFVELLKSCFELLRHLQGKPPSSMKVAKDGGVFVENNDGKIVVFNQPTINLVINTNVSKAAEAFVKRPLERGRKSLDIVSNGQKIVHIDRKDAEKFSEILRSDVLLERTYETYLTVRTAVLEGDGVWRFNDGRHVIIAKMEDAEFLVRVRQGEERFGRGDILLVRLRAVQRKESGALKTEYFVEEVLSHQANPDVGGQSKLGL